MYKPVEIFGAECKVVLNFNAYDTYAKRTWIYNADMTQDSEETVTCDEYVIDGDTIYNVLTKQLNAGGDTICLTNTWTVIKPDWLP